MSTLDKYRRPRTSHQRSCRICGEPTAARVAVQLLEKSPAGKAGYKALDSFSGSYCEKHAVEVYEAVGERMRGV